MAQAEEFIATGRRKTSVARIRMTAGQRQNRHQRQQFRRLFSDRAAAKHRAPAFAGRENGERLRPFHQRNRRRTTGQAGAVRLAIARALLQVNGDLRGTLKAEGLLMRDPRMKERKKSGQPGARKRFQFSKR